MLTFHQHGFSPSCFEHLLHRSWSISEFVIVCYRIPLTVSDGGDFQGNVTAEKIDKTTIKTKNQTS